MNLTFSGKILIVPKNDKGFYMNDISSVIPMLSQMMGGQQNTLPQQLQQLVNTAGANGAAHNLSKSAAVDSLTLSPATASLQQLLNAEMSNSGQDSESANGESGLMGLAQLKNQGELAATLFNAKMRNVSSAAGLGTAERVLPAKQYAQQSSVHFVRHIIEGKPER